MGFPLPTRAEHIWVCILTARCNMACSYCIQKGLVLPGTPRKPWRKYEELSGSQWVKAFNDLPVRPERPLILTGGEPTAHRDFLEIIAGLEGYRIDLTSNLRCDLDALIAAVEKSGRPLYSSFHTYAPEHMEPEEYIARAERILAAGIIENPLFSTVNLDLFPQFTTRETEERVVRVYRLAVERGLPMMRSEFRANHLGRPFMREERSPIECSSGWVNIAPDGEIFNCQYHLTEGRNSFGNICRPGEIRPLPTLGTFFPCQDFGWCDPCHENSGTGMFRDPDTGQVFRRDPDASHLNYSRWLTPEELQEAGRRFVEAGRHGEGIAFFQAALDKRPDPSLMADLGVALWNADRPAEAQQRFTQALEAGYDDPACRQNLVAVTAELVQDRTRSTGNSPKRILIDIRGHWGLGDLLCADALVDGLASAAGDRETEIRIRGKAGNLAWHPLVAGPWTPEWQADRVVEVKLFTHMDQGEFARLEALPSLVDHMCSYGEVAPKERKPRLHLTAQDRARADELDLPRHPCRPLVALCADFVDPNRHWPRERWALVAEHLRNRGADLVMMGIQPSLGGGLDLCDGRLDMRSLAAVLERCDLYLGNNTGTFHYAQAAGTPCLTLFSLALPQRFIHDRALVVPVQAGLRCTNCKTLEARQGPACCPGTGTCMEAIETAGVINALDWFLAGYFDRLDDSRRETPAARSFREDTYRRHAYALRQFGHGERADQFDAMAAEPAGAPALIS